MRGKLNDARKRRCPIAWCEMTGPEKEVYSSPELVKAGDVKELTLGGTGAHQDSGAAGSYTVR